MQTWTHADKSTWGDGPWQDEPDKVQWIDEATGLDCLIVRNHHGALCGYVGVPPGHPLHGKDTEEADRFEVHGGLTFAGGCDEDAPEGHGICHVPEPGRPDDVWWLGFDCGHAWDVIPGMEAHLRELGMPPLRLPDFQRMPRTLYKTVPYVRAEVTSLAKQLVAVK